MEYYLIVAHSMTQAQKMQKTLECAGIRGHIFRAPRGLTDAGCAYTVRIAAPDLASALTVLHKEALSPVQIFLYQSGLYKEVRP